MIGLMRSGTELTQRDVPDGDVDLGRAKQAAKGFHYVYRDSFFTFFSTFYLTFFFLFLFSASEDPVKTCNKKYISMYTAVSIGAFFLTDERSGTDGTTDLGNKQL